LDQAVFEAVQSLPEVLLQQLVTTALHHEPEWCLEQTLSQEEQLYWTMYSSAQAICLATLQPAGFWLPHSTVKVQARYLTVLPVNLQRHVLCRISHCVCRVVEQLLDEASSGGSS
jgi:hypothetical protein